MSIDAQLTMLLAFNLATTWALWYVLGRIHESKLRDREDKKTSEFVREARLH